MIFLDAYKNYFDRCYPRYGEQRYREICRLVAALPAEGQVEACLDSDQGRTVLELITPLVEIVNYKSQKPFPTDLPGAIREITKLKNAPSPIRFSDEHKRVFEALLCFEGLQLPTASAFFHFCYPNQYPIVDRFIKAGCEKLLDDNGDEFGNLAAPMLPVSTTSLDNKLEKYKHFIKVLDTIKSAHNRQYETDYGYRELDKALMVFGKVECRQRVETALGHADD